MSFGSLFDGGAGGGGGGMQFPFSTGFSSSPALSLGLVRACLVPLLRSFHFRFTFE
jgi:homeobox-leucine zipper protein